jgi:hypothetical protein
MEYLTSFIDIILHLDKHLAMLVQQYGPWIYAILFRDHLQRNRLCGDAFPAR